MRAGITDSHSQECILVYATCNQVSSICTTKLTNIDLIGKKRKSCESGATSSSPSSKKPVREASESEQMQFLNALDSCPGAKPAVLAVTPGYCDAYVPASLAPE